MTDLRQMIIDRATAFNEAELARGETAIRWTPSDLAEIITEEKWTNGATHTCDLEEIAGTVNHHFKDRQPARQPEEEQSAAPISDEDEAPNGTPFLLPIDKMDGYFVDPWGRPHADKRAGRKGGVITVDKFFRKDRTFICGYRIRLGAKRKRFTPRYFIMARFFAEQKWINSED